MKRFSAIQCFCAAFCFIILVSELVSAAPSSYSEYENIFPDLYQYLLQSEAQQGRLGQHQIVRKSSRSPSLRLRFGRRSDPSVLVGSPYILSDSDSDRGDN